MRHEKTLRASVVRLINPTTETQRHRGEFLVIKTNFVLFVPSW